MVISATINPGYVLVSAISERTFNYSYNKNISLDARRMRLNETMSMSCVPSPLRYSTDITPTKMASRCPTLSRTNQSKSLPENVYGYGLDPTATIQKTFSFYFHFALCTNVHGLTPFQP